MQFAVITESVPSSRLFFMFIFFLSWPPSAIHSGETFPSELLLVSFLERRRKKAEVHQNRTTSVYWETCFLFLQRHPPSGTIRMPCSSLSCLASWAGRVWISHLDDVAYIYSTCLVSLGYRSNDKSIFTPPNQRIEGEKRGKREEKRSVLCSPWPEITQRMHEFQMRFNNVLSNQPYHVALLIYDLSPFVFNPSSCDLTFSLNPSRRYFTGSHLFNLLYIYVT